MSTSSEHVVRLDKQRQGDISKGIPLQTFTGSWDFVDRTMS